MGFTKLEDRINGLPLILAGPMVRRVEPTSVSVWLALREARNVRLHVFDPAGDFESDPTPTVAIGEFLHMVVVTARPPQPLPDGAVRNYTISFEPEGGGAKEDLFDRGVLAQTKSEAQQMLVYASDPKGPSFMVPPDTLDKLRMFHTSCRKIDGQGIDAFPAIDQALDEALRNPNDKLRPAMLFLTGDQIYADGSAQSVTEAATGDTLPAILMDIGATLLGVDEILPVVHKRPEDLPGIRSLIAVDDVGLKNPNLHPAFSLGEFIALYLLTFSDVLWPPDHDGHKSFRRGLLATRRIFANLATYMIFDDHELADSWYLTKSWCEPLFKSELGRRVLQNSLSAYALFQAWGNTPDQFAGSQNPPGLVLLNALVDWRIQIYLAGSQPQRDIARVLGIPDAQTFAHANFDLSDDVFHKPSTQILPWHYTVPCKALTINVLDVYTWRKFDGEFEPADHLPSRALDAQVTKIGAQPLALYVASNVVINRYGRIYDDPASLPALYRGLRTAGAISAVTAVGLFAAKGLFSPEVFSKILVTVVALAVVALAAALYVIPKLIRALRQVHYEEIGTEFEWHHPVFERLLERLARDSAHTINNQQFARVLLLSGDVHNSFAMRLSHFSQFSQGKPGLTASFAQLVSSPSKYVDEGARSYDERSSGEFVAWKKANQSQPPAIKPGGKEVKWLGTGEYWVAKITPDLPEFTEPENHRYKIEPNRPRVEPLQFAPLSHPAKTLADLTSHLSAHQQLTLIKARHSDIVRANNVSDVTFEVAGDKIKVRQDVWWWYSGLAEDPPGWFIRTYEVNMDPIPPPTMPGATP
ncbi:MAG TPA: hypothetical protein VHS05_07300 [Pyrinomonadaceae bacterium]|nr:hypothetical protein [Pyrinomonadaceae bacterium]